MTNIAMMSTVGIFHLVLYMVIAKVVMASNLQDGGSSFLLNETNCDSGSGSGSGDQSGSGVDHIDRNGNSTTCHCNETDLVVSGCFLNKWLSPTKKDSGFHKLSSETYNLISITDNKEVSVC